MPSTFSIPGIQSIAYLPTSSLPAYLDWQHQASIPICIFSARTPIRFAGEPTLEVETTNQNGGSRQSATLSFKSLDTLPEHYPIAFIITAASGSSYLLGHKEEPYPLIESVKHFGNTSSDISALHVQVTFIASKALIPCTLG